MPVRGGKKPPRVPPAPGASAALDASPSSPTVSELLDFLEEVPVARDGPCTAHCLAKVGRVDCYDRSHYLRQGYSKQQVASLSRVPLFYDETGTCSCQETKRRCTLWCRVAPAYPLLEHRQNGPARYGPGLHLTYSARTCVAADDLDPRYVARADLAWRRMVLDHGAPCARRLRRVPGWWGIRKLPPRLLAEAADVARGLAPWWAVARDLSWEEIGRSALADERPSARARRARSAARRPR